MPGRGFAVKRNVVKRVTARKAPIGGGLFNNFGNFGNQQQEESEQEDGDVEPVRPPKSTFRTAIRAA